MIDNILIFACLGRPFKPDDPYPRSSGGVARNRRARGTLPLRASARASARADERADEGADEGAMQLIEDRTGGPLARTLAGPFAGLFVWALAAALLVAGCAGTPRTPYDPALGAVAEIPGIPNARLYLDADPAVVRERTREIVREAADRDDFHVLALSGGGASGAFGAGVVTGWSASGARPDFDIVSGVSIGALIAPLAFLGATYDPVIEGLFADGSAARIVQFGSLFSILEEGVLDPEPLERLIARIVDRRLLAEIAREHRRGRRLFVTTTNLDAQRGVIWDMGAIATSGAPGALDLFRKVLQASAALPGAYAPVLVEVEAMGRRFDEMHVDGGVTANVLVVPEAVIEGRIAAAATPGRGHLWIVVNGHLGPEFEVVDRAALTVAVRSFSTTVKVNTNRILDETRAFARRRGLSVAVAAIAPSFPGSDPLAFDRDYMRASFAHGYARAMAGVAFDGRAAAGPVAAAR